MDFVVTCCVDPDLNENTVSTNVLHHIKNLDLRILQGTDIATHTLQELQQFLPKMTMHTLEICEYQRQVCQENSRVAWCSLILNITVQYYLVVN